MKVYINVRFVEQYHGVEFPAAPMRFLQAIVASSQDKFMNVLNALEAQTPVIYAVEPRSKYEYSRYVINNDEKLDHNNSGTKKNTVTRMFNDAAAHIVYEYDVPAELLPALESVMRCVTVLGHATDWVLCSLSFNEPAKLDRYVPGSAELKLRVPVQGSIASVFARWEDRKAALKFKNQGYVKNASTAAPRRIFELTEPAPMQQTSLVVSWIRHAAIAKKVQGISGHELGDRITVLPLPTLDWGSGQIRYVAITSADEQQLKAAATRMAGLHPTDKDGQERGYLLPAESNAVTADYFAPFKRWTSVTPVLQTGYHNNKASKQTKIYTKMIKQAGLGSPKVVAVQPYRDKDFVVAKEHGHDKLPRVRMVIEFAEPVPGPVTLGTGRYTGLGIFAHHSR